MTFRKIRVCLKAGKHSGPITRHHKGHEYLFAILLPDKYAKRYMEFRPEDTAELCQKHHLKIHKLYHARLVDLWPLLKEQDGKITYEQAEFFRKKLVGCCNRWLAQDTRTTNERPNKSRQKHHRKRQKSVRSHSNRKRASNKINYGSGESYEGEGLPWPLES